MSTSAPIQSHPEAVPVPPDEQFWKKYSSHFEFPISSVGTVFVHILIFLALIGVWVVIPGARDETPIEAAKPVSVALPKGAGGLDSGGFGDPGGDRQEQTDSQDVFSTFHDPAPVELAKAMPVVEPWISKDIDPAAREQFKRSEAFANISRTNEQIRDGLFKGLKDQSGATGGGDGTGGAGDAGSGGGDPEGDKTAKRLLRWTINFETTSGRNYVEQLEALGAVLIVPQPPNWDTAHVIRDLRNPNPGRPEPLDQFKSLFFTDDRPDSVASVSRSLGLGFVPPNFTAVFPKKLEERMAILERKYRNRTEDEIFSTTFKVVTAGGRIKRGPDGEPSIIVAKQVPANRAGQFNR